MAAGSAFYTNELGRVHIGRPLIVRAIEPELTLEKKVEPAASVKNSIDISYAEGKVLIAVRLAVAYGVNIQSIAPKVQERIKRSVETLTGLGVSEVTVNVERVFAPAEAPSLEVKPSRKKGGDAL